MVREVERSTNVLMTFEESTGMLKKAESVYKGHRSLLMRTRNLLSTMERQDVIYRLLLVIMQFPKWQFHASKPCTMNSQDLMFWPRCSRGFGCKRRAYMQMDWETHPSNALERLRFCPMMRRSTPNNLL